MSELLLDRAGRRRSPRRCRDSTPARLRLTRRLRYPADPPRVEETIAFMRAAGEGRRRSRSPTQVRSTPVPPRHAVEMAREGVPLIVIQRRLGHSNLGITGVHPQGIDSGEIIETVHARRAPMVPVRVSLRL